MIEIAVDIGGTFTDVVLFKDDEVYSTKVPSTPPNLVTGVLNGVKKILQIVESSPSNIDRFIHGTTVATNAVLERKGAVMGMLLTKGHEDILETGRQRRERMYDLFLDPETPLFLSPRRMRIGINERIGPEGEVVHPLDEEEIIRGVKYLREGFGINAVAVCYLFSFKNPVHERRTKEIVQKEFPGLSISISSDVDPVFREYERLCVTGFDTYLRPVIENYVDNLDRSLQEIGVSTRLQLMQSRGGITSANVAIEKPITTFLSGPAAGAIAGKYISEQTGNNNLVTLDMGGTSCDVALISDGDIEVSTEGKIVGYPIRVPMVDVSTIGAGGGSIAWIDAAGGLRVGPQSAGADPGPVSYSKGGVDATVTDASLVLGYLNPDFFAGGEIKLDIDASMKAIESLGKRIGLNSTQCAAGIHQIINSSMANQIRLITVSRGVDPRRYSLLLLGGAGPVHGGALVSELPISTLLVSEKPGVLSAFGLLVANIEHDSSKTFGVRSRQFDYEIANRIFEELDQQCQKKMEQNKVELDNVKVIHLADLRYVGQSHSIEIPFEDTVTKPETVRDLIRRFRDKHEEIYGHKSMEDEVEFVNLRVVHSFPLPKLGQRKKKGGSNLDNAFKGFRKAYFREYGEYTEVAIYDRDELPANKEIEGPIVIEQADTTTVVYPNQTCVCDEANNLIISVRRPSVNED